MAAEDSNASRQAAQDLIDETLIQFDVVNANTNTQQINNIDPPQSDSDIDPPLSNIDYQIFLLDQKITDLIEQMDMQYLSTDSDPPSTHTCTPSTNTNHSSTNIAGQIDELCQHANMQHQVLMDLIKNLRYEVPENAEQKSIENNGYLLQFSAGVFFAASMYSAYKSGFNTKDVTELPDTPTVSFISRFRFWS